MFLIHSHIHLHTYGGGVAMQSARLHGCSQKHGQYKNKEKAP